MIASPYFKYDSRVLDDTEMKQAFGMLRSGRYTFEQIADKLKIPRPALVEQMHGYAKWREDINDG